MHLLLPSHPAFGCNPLIHSPILESEFYPFDSILSNRHDACFHYVPYFIAVVLRRVELLYLLHGKVSSKDKTEKSLKLIPNKTVHGVYVDLVHLRFDKESKNGSRSLVSYELVRSTVRLFMAC